MATRGATRQATTGIAFGLRERKIRAETKSIEPNWAQISSIPEFNPCYGPLDALTSPKLTRHSPMPLEGR